MPIDNPADRYRSRVDSPPTQTTSQSASGSQVRETSEVFESSGPAADQLEDDDEEEEEDDDDPAEGDDVLLNLDDVTGSRSPIKPTVGPTIGPVDGFPVYGHTHSPIFTNRSIY